MKKPKPDYLREVYAGHKMIEAAQAASARGTSEPAAPLGALASATCSELHEKADRAAREILEAWDVERYEINPEGPIAGYAGRYTTARPSQLVEIILKHFAPNKAISQSATHEPS